MARQDDRGGVSWYGTDRQGTVRQIFDNSGGETHAAEYDAFGLVLRGTLLDRYGFHGREHDSLTGLRHHRAREFNGQFWMSEDPIGFAAGDANLYRFVGNGPGNATDPSGFCDYQDHHAYPLYLGGSNSQPLFRLTTEQHIAFHRYFNSQGFGPVGKPDGRGTEWNTARDNWKKLTDKQRILHIRRGLEAAGVHSSIANTYMKEIMAGANPGIPTTRTSERGKVILPEDINKAKVNAGRLLKLTAVFPGFIVMGGVSFANDKVIETGEVGGYKLANKTGLMRWLRTLDNETGLPRDIFLMQWRDKEIRISYEYDKSTGVWYMVVDEIERTDSGCYKSITPIIKRGELPVDLRPGDELYHKYPR